MYSSNLSAIEHAFSVVGHVVKEKRAVYYQRMSTSWSSLVQIKKLTRRKDKCKSNNQTVR